MQDTGSDLSMADKCKADTFQDRGGIEFLIVLADVLAVYLALILAFQTRVRLEGILAVVPLSHGLALYLSKWWITGIILLSIFYYGGYGIVVTVWDDLLTIWRSLVASFFIVWVTLSLQKEAETVSRIIVTLSFSYMLALIPFTRLAVKFVLFRVMQMKRPALLYGHDRQGVSDTLRTLLNSEWYSGYAVSDAGQNRGAEKFDTCFLPMELADEKTVKSLKPTVKNVIVVSEIPGFSFMKSEVKTLFGKNMSFITMRNGLLLRRNMLIKSIADRFLSVLALAIFWPVLVIIGLLVKADTRGPAVFRHIRCGKRLAEFGMYKYRTMRVDGDEMLTQYLKENPDAQADLLERNKIEKDPRITRVGRFLRSTSLDELPQLLNVIKGQMSIVGPRPDSKDVIAKYAGEYEEIYRYVRPGITGLWQVSGRSDIKYDERVKLDYLYVLNWSLWLDFVIILKTFRAILGRKGAY
jgi:exopolysaccharide biosynthesis polyprenyl glycosylphosphotransferase